MTVTPHVLRLTALGAASVLTLTACAADGGGTGGSTAGAFELDGAVTMVVPFSAGGGSDAAGRAMAAGLEAATGANVSVENREGGSGAVGYSHLLSRSGDAGTLLASETSLSSIPLTQDVEFGHDSFTPIMKVGDDFTLIVAPADSPFRTCSDAVEAASSERVVAAVSGAVSLDQIVFRLIEIETGATFDRVPFESGGEVLAALLGGQVQIASLNPGEVVGQLESGDLRALCAVSEERYDYEELADIPTAAEQGIDVSFAQWRGFIAPAGIDDAARDFWVSAGKEYAATSEYAQYIEDNYMQPTTLYGEDLVDYLEQYHADLAAALDQ